MNAGSVTRQDVLRKLDQLPPEGLAELALFIDFLAFKERRPPQRPAAASGSDAEALLPGSATARFRGFVRSPISVAELLDDYELTLMGGEGA